MFKSVSTTIAAAVFMLFAASADVAPPSHEPPKADVFVKSLYTQKLEAEAASPDFGRARTDSLILNYFSAELLGLFKAAMASSEPIVDGDVFMNAQDWDTKEVSTKIVSATADTATVEAEFKVFDDVRKVTFTLKMNKAAYWEIDEIASTHMPSLRQMIVDGLKAQQH